MSAQVKSYRRLGATSLKLKLWQIEGQLRDAKKILLCAKAQFYLERLLVLSQ